MFGGAEQWHWLWCCPAVAVVSSIGWIRRTSLKDQLLIPSLTLQVHLVCMLKGLGSCVLRESKAYDQEIKSLPDEAGNRPGFIFKGTTWYNSLEGEDFVLEAAAKCWNSFSAWNCRAVPKLAYGSRGMFQWQAALWWPLKKFLGHPGSSSLSVLSCASSAHRPPVCWMTPSQDGASEFGSRWTLPGMAGTRGWKASPWSVLPCHHAFSLGNESYPPHLCRHGEADLSHVQCI